MKNLKKHLSMMLVVTLLIVNANMATFAGSNLNNSLVFYETNNGFVMQYEKNEDGQTYYYDEKVVNDIVYTKKYKKNDGKLNFVEELQTSFDKKSNGSVVAVIDNRTTNVVQSHVVIEEEISLVERSSGMMLMAASKEWHPKDDEYYKVTRSTGHKGLSNLTTAAVTFALGTVITGGNLVSGGLAGIATAVVNGGWSNLYYENTTYYPYGSGAGRPLWKKIVKYYYDRDRTNQCGDTLYYEADILTKY